MANRRGSESVRTLRLWAAVATLCALLLTFSCATMYVHDKDPISLAAGQATVALQHLRKVATTSTSISPLLAPLGLHFYQTVAILHTFICGEAAGGCAGPPWKILFSSVPPLLPEIFWLF